MSTQCRSLGPWMNTDFFFIHIFYTSMDSAVSVRLRVYLCECGTWIVPKKRTFYNEDGNSPLWSFKMHSFLKVITNKTSSKLIKYFVDDYQKDKRNTLYSLSRVFNFGTNLHCAPHLQMLVIFLPLHVEKLLSLYCKCCPQLPGL